jgi:hypothetical protein
LSACFYYEFYIYFGHGGIVHGCNIHTNTSKQAETDCIMYEERGCDCVCIVNIFPLQHGRQAARGASFPLFCIKQNRGKNAVPATSRQSSLISR